MPESTHLARASRGGAKSCQSPRKSGVRSIAWRDVSRLRRRIRRAWRGARGGDGRAPRRELRTERALELADVLCELGLDGARGERLAHRRERGDVTPSLVERTTEQRP